MFKMHINKKVLLKQLLGIYKYQGIRGLFAYLFNIFRYRVLKPYIMGSFSQRGEDIIINKYFKGKRGFYVDVGASHPSRLSNTKLLYDNSWCGINIEPNVQKIELFLAERTRDINLNIGIGKKNGKAIFYEFEASGLSTFSKDRAETLIKEGYKLRRKLDIPIRRLDYILEKNVEGNIDFMSIDTEGYDIDVLQSNNWNKFRPKLICIETIDFTDLLKNGGLSSHKKEIDEFLWKKGYREYCHTDLNTIYIDKKFGN